MSDVNLQLVRDFFELNDFRTMPNWHHDGSDRASQLLVQRSTPAADIETSFVLQPHMLGAIERAAIEIRAWHTDRFYPSVIEANPILWQFASEEARNAPAEHFGTPEFATILVVSELPGSAEPRSKSIARLEEAGIDHVVEFPTLLRDLLHNVSVHGQYEGSPTLQVLRLLKRYKLTRRQQLEFLFGPKDG